MIGIGVGSAAGLRITPGEMTFNNAYKIWHSGNMGSGSALDADTIDGIDSSFFALNSNVQAMSAGLNSRIGTVENSIQTFDSKFVNISGDSMTGPLIINGGSASPIPFKPNITIESSGSDQISNVKNVEMQTTITNNGSNEQIYSTVNNIKSSILIETTGTGTINSVSDPIHLANYRTGGITLSGNISGYSGIAFHSEGVNLDNGSYLVEYKGLDSGRASVNAGSRIETVYGVHIPQNNNYGGIIDKEYGVYQEQLGVDNYFAGNVEIVGNLLVHGSVNISGASTIPTVAFFARTDSGQTVSNSTRTDLTFEDEVIDTHNGHNSSTGVYTVPLSGVYQVSAQVTYSTLQANDTMQFFIYKNGTEYVSAYDVANVGSSIFSIKTHAVMNCAENDTIEVYAYVGSFSSRSLRAVSQDNYLSIVRIK
jgi:hypothetical protein